MSTSENAPLDREDVTALRRMNGTDFASDVTMPSGRVMSGEEAARALLEIEDSKAIVARVFEEMGIDPESAACVPPLPEPVPAVSEKTAAEPWHYGDRKLRPSWGLLVFFALFVGAVGCSIGYAGAGLGWW